MVWILTLLVVVTLTVGMRISASRLRKSALADLRQAEDAGSGREQDFHRNEADAKRRIAMGLGMAPIAILAIFVFFTIARSIKVVDTGDVAVVYQFGDIVGQRSSGLQFIAPWQNTRVQNVQVQRFSNTDERSAPYEVFSRETQDVFVRITLNYSVNPKDVQRLFREIGPNWFDRLVEARVENFLKDEAVKYTAVDIAPNRETIRIAVRDRLATELSPFSITVQDFLINNIDFTPAFKDAIQLKQIAQQQAEAAKNVVESKKAEAQQAIEKARGEAEAAKISAGGQAEAIRLRAEGQAAANKLLSESLTDRIIQYEAIQKISPNINVALLPAGQGLIIDAGSLVPGTTTRP